MLIYLRAKSSLISVLLAQAVRAMESVGRQVDKARIKRALEDMMRQQSAALQGRQRKRSRNEGLERLKFWLGIPNSYYGTDWRARDNSSDESGEES